MTSGTLTPLAPEQFDALKRGDESVLADVFKADYAVLEREAEAELHDPAAAARAVEHAFVHAWADRDKVEAPEGFNAVLLNALHEETAREKRRIAAAHRMAGAAAGHVVHEPVPVDAAWRKVVETLHPKEIDPAELAARRHEGAKHHAAHAVAELSNRTNPMLVGGAVALVIAAGLGLTWWLDKGSEGARITQALASPDAATVKTEPGQMGSLRLADGGEVQLAPMSSVKLPPGYNVRWRAVAADGAMILSVPTNPELPFEVRIGKATVVATGTKFAVRKFADESHSAVRVLEGSVEVRLPNKQVTPVLAGQTVIVGDADVVAASAAETARLTGWVDGMITVKGETLADVLPQMRRWWGLVITVKDPAIGNVGAEFSAPATDPTAAIAELEKATTLKLVWENKQMVLRPAPDKTGR